MCARTVGSPAKKSTKAAKITPSSAVEASAEPSPSPALSPQLAPEQAPAGATSRQASAKDDASTTIKAPRASKRVAGKRAPSEPVDPPLMLSEAAVTPPAKAKTMIATPVVVDPVPPSASTVAGHASRSGDGAKASKPVSVPMVKLVSHDMISHRAWEIWNEEGCPQGRELEHWLRAERELRR